uniref:Tudor domain-containing protein 3 n=1 Tax=Clastoptera arizonana TaxID=38151 RepID=A0A1B6DJ63_9HEMI
MDLMEGLKNRGWYLTNEAIQTLSDNSEGATIESIEAKALDLDLREIGQPILPEKLSKGKLGETISIPSNVIVQIQKISNISAPKANEESRAAPRFLKLLLTDGHIVCHAVELESIDNLSINTPPGTKLLLKGKDIFAEFGIVLLNPSCVNILGGRVPVLIEKWEVNRRLAKHTRGRIGEEGGPPPWIPFGQKIVRPNIQDTNFKSLGDPSNKENAEFEAQRQGAIAEAARAGARKVFGGGNKPVFDRNLRQIIDLGYTQEQAEIALKQSKNNVDQAIRNLKRREGGNRGGRENNRRRGDRDDDGGTSGPKPSGKVSLFDFLEDKLPAQNDKDLEFQEKNQTSFTTTGSNANQNSYSNRNSSFRGRYERGNRGGRGGHHSSSDKKEDRNRNNNTSSQKPPRFQNQLSRNQESFNFYQNWNYSNEFNNEDKRANNSSKGGGNFEQFSSDNYPRKNHSNSFTPGNDNSDFPRNSRKYDNYGSSNSGNNYKSVNNSSSYSRQMLEAKMPEIPEFPFKDPSSIPSLMSSNNGSFYQSSFRPPNQHHTTNEVASVKNSENTNTVNWQWKKGDKCMAKYWEDNMYYNAEVTGLSKKTCVVRFLEYGNFEEVLQDDCIPLSDDGRDTKNLANQNQYTNFGNPSQSQSGNNNHFSGILEFRRGGSRPYIKSAETTGHRKQSNRITQQMYVPPAQRRDSK